MLEDRLFVLNCGHEACAPGHSYGPTVRSHYLIHFIVKGCGIFEANGKRHALGPGEGFLILPGQLTFYQADHQDPWEYSWVGYMGPDAPQLTAHAQLSAAHPLFRLDQPEEAHAILQAIQQDTASFPRSGLSQQSAIGGLMRLMARIGENRLTSTGQAPLPAASYFEKACWFFQGRLDRQVTVEEAASFVGLSRSQLFRVFKTTINHSPKEYLTSLKVERACELLQSDQLSIEGVCSAIGFQSPAYFATLFHAHTGMTPSRYREQQRRLRHTKGLSP